MQHKLLFVFLCILQYMCLQSGASNVWSMAENETSTTSTTYQNVASLIQNVIESSDFVMHWEAELQASALAGTVDVRFILNNTNVYGEQRLAPSPLGSGWAHAGGNVPFTETPLGTHTWAIQYRSGTALQNVSIRRARIWAETP